MHPEAEAAYLALYDGNKAKVREVGDALLAAVEALGPGVRITVTKLYVAMATERQQFGLFFPSSGRRVTLRLRLDGRMAPTGRLEQTVDRNPNGRFDVRAFLSHPDHIDDDLVAAIRKARDLAK